MKRLKAGRALVNYSQGALEYMYSPSIGSANLAHFNLPAFDALFRRTLFQAVGVYVAGCIALVVAMELLRWLGPDAELIEPQEWREAFRDELRRMLKNYC